MEGSPPLKTAISAILLQIPKASWQPEEIASVLKQSGFKTNSKEVQTALMFLQEELTEVETFPYNLKEVNHGWTLVQKFELLNALGSSPAAPAPLKESQLEVLAVISYRQPITRNGIENILCRDVFRDLLWLTSCSLIKAKQKTYFYYETTPYFLEKFGLRALEELPDYNSLKTPKLKPLPSPAAETIRLGFSE
jgi:segregation and condensation protein B